MWQSIINYLADPQLVIKTQKFFGIEYDTKEVILQNNVDFIKKLSKNKFNNSTTDGCDFNKLSSHHNNKNSKFDYSSDLVHSEDEVLPCKITNHFWFHLFNICTALGDEVFYALFYPFWFWNIDGAVGRRMVMVWCIVMYIGQGIKDIIRMPRPGPPVQKLQKKWVIEYGMPSTHAMAGVSMPFSIFIFTLSRYQYAYEWGFLFASLWCSLMCLSRIYLGMHSVLDIVAGLLLAVLLMFPVVPLADALDNLILTSRWSPPIVLIISVVVIIYYPNSDKWTPTRGDTTVIVSVCAGIQIGAWCNYHMGHMKVSDVPPPYKILWPTYDMLGMLILRTVLGVCGMVATRAIAKSVSYGFVCTLLGRDKNELRNSPNSLQNRDKIIVELCYKYFTYLMIGFNIVLFSPNVFKLIGIERPTFYTEI